MVLVNSALAKFISLCLTEQNILNNSQAFDFIDKIKLQNC